MAEQVTITNMPESGSPARVALDLARQIANLEFQNRGQKWPENPREYWIGLFKECRQVVY
jgi:hypothetical protein